jgi:two-component system, chemotaxis family, protein-glutamate methylesterase/glutaminase
LRKDIIVLGGSAGAVETLSELVGGLPHDLDAAVLVVIHVPPHSAGHLVDILQRRTALRVTWAQDDGAIEPGHVYVAPPDRHLIVEGGRMRLTDTALEHHNRPAIDPLFRSTALEYGPRAIAVVLSGRLDDGTAGLHTVKELGGTTVVQDPDDALHPDMPRNAMAGTMVDHVVPVADLATLLARLVAESRDGVTPNSV